MKLQINEQDQQELLVLVKTARFEEHHRQKSDTQRIVALHSLQGRLEAAK
jgi:hypothetical protein